MKDLAMPLKNPRVLLVQPNYQKENAGPNKIDNIVGVHPPLGLLYLAAVLREESCSVQIADANVRRARAKDILPEASLYDVVGVSVLNQGHDFALSLAGGLPEGILKVCGGPHATGYAETMLQGGYDVVVRGEGEEALRQICKGLPLNDIPGIVFRNGNGFVRTAGPARLDVARIPLPARDLLPHGGTRWPYASAGTRMFPWAPVFTSRGCPFRCYYCNKTIHGHAFRPRPAEDVVNEMVILVEQYGVREFDIVDDVFNLDIGRAIRICDLIRRSGLRISMRFGNGIRADRVTPELARKLRAAGTHYVAFGLESGSQRVLDAIPKNITLTQVRRGVRLIQEQGIHTTGLFMLGLMEDDLTSMEQTIAFACSLNLDIAYFSIATPYPGSRFYEMVRERGRLLAEDWKDFNHSYGRMLYRYPGAPSPDLVHTMFRRAYRSFYFRPGYLARQALKRRNANDWTVTARGLRDLMRNLFVRGKAA